MITSLNTSSLRRMIFLEARIGRGITPNNSSNTQKVGDIITGIDGRHLRSIDDLITYIDLHKSIGDNVGLTVNRHGQIMNLNLVLQARPQPVQNATSLESILP
ncbi:MAG: PDZ domain-containing protein [Candidatus Nitrosopolaris sp.]